MSSITVYELKIGKIREIYKNIMIISQDQPESVPSMWLQTLVGVEFDI